MTAVASRLLSVTIVSSSHSFNAANLKLVGDLDPQDFI
jgi:hypothetical protein